MEVDSIIQLYLIFFQPRENRGGMLFNVICSILIDRAIRIFGSTVGDQP